MDIRGSKGGNLRQAYRGHRALYTGTGMYKSLAIQVGNLAVAVGLSGRILASPPGVAITG